MDIISNAAAATAGPLNRKGNVIRTRTNLHNNICASDIGPRTTVQNTNNDNNDDNDSFLHCNDDNHDALFNSLGQLESKKDVTPGEGFAQLTLPFRSTLMIPSAIANSNDAFSLSSPSSYPSPSLSPSPSATPMRVSSLSLTSSTNSFVSRSTPLSSSTAPLASTRQQASSSSIANLNVQDLPFFSSPFRSIPDTLPSEDAATLSRTLLTMTGSSDALPVATPTPIATTTSMDKKRQDDDPQTALDDIQGGQSSVLSLSACTEASMYRDLSRGMSEQKDGSVPCHDQVSLHTSS
ncbi:hypothetical protein F5H01DRAFT_48080 [Linnemannia elongata]|nr:hypothetical protein F5H01DRAFT_48080 [Linnemannia elongata]